MWVLKLSPCSCDIHIRINGDDECDTDDTGCDIFMMNMVFVMMIKPLRVTDEVMGVVTLMIMTVLTGELNYSYCGDQ